MFQTSTAANRAAIYETDLRQFMIGIFNRMASAVALTGLVAYLVSLSPVVSLLFGTPLVYVLMFAPLAFTLVLSFGIDRMSYETASAVFWSFAATMGMSLSAIFLVYTGASIAKVFFITSAMFAGMSLYGYATKRDLSSMGTFLIMGTWGLLIASIVNLFLGSDMLSWMISVLSVLVFTGLTAYDVQTSKETYLGMRYDSSGEDINKLSLFASLNLYLNFIVIFVHLLRLIGVKKDD